MNVFIFSFFFWAGDVAYAGGIPECDLGLADNGTWIESTTRIDFLGSASFNLPKNMSFVSQSSTGGENPWHLAMFLSDVQGSAIKSINVYSSLRKELNLDTGRMKRLLCETTRNGYKALLFDHDAGDIAVIDAVGFQVIVHGPEAHSFVLNIIKNL